MALTRDNIVTTVQIENTGGLTTGDISTEFRDRVLARASAILNDVPGAISDTNSTFLEQAYTETVYMDGKKSLLRLSHGPVVLVSTVKLNGTTQDYTVKKAWESGIDVWIKDNPTVGIYNWWALEKHYGNWAKGYWEITYTAGYDNAGATYDNSVPEGLRDAIIALALYMHNTEGSQGLSNVKIGDIGYGFNGSNARGGVPGHILDMFDDYKPAAV